MVSLQHLDISQLYVVVDSDVRLLVTSDTRATKAAISGDPATDALKAWVLVTVKVNHIAGLCALVTGTGLAGSRFLSRPRPRALSTRPIVGSGSAYTMDIHLSLQRSGACQRSVAAALDRASSAGWSEHYIDSPKRLDHVSDSGPATCTQSAGDSLF